VTWLPPELDDGTEDGELRPLDEDPEELLDSDPEELLDELPELLVPLDVPEVPEPEVDCWVLLAAEPDDAWWVAPGRLNATAPAAIRLAVAAETVTARSRAAPRSRSLAPGAAPRGVLLWWWVMPASVPTGSRSLLWATSQPAMRLGARSAPRVLPHAVEDLADQVHRGLRVQEREPGHGLALPRRGRDERHLVVQQLVGPAGVLRGSPVAAAE